MENPIKIDDLGVPPIIRNLHIEYGYRPQNYHSMPVEAIDISHGIYTEELDGFVFPSRSI